MKEFELIEVVCPRCVNCYTQTIMKLDAAKIARWRDGEYLQELFPDMSKEDREVLISGTCPGCWLDMFGDGDDYE